MPNLQPTIPQKKKKQPNYNGQALLGAGLIGAGGAAHGLKHLVLGNSDMEAVNAFTNAAKSSWAHGSDPRGALLEYANTGNQILNATPMGTDAPNLMNKIRDPKLLATLSKIPGLSGVKDFSMQPGTELHYQQFQKSPLDGYLEMHREMAGGNPAITHGYAKGTYDNLKHTIRSNWFRPSAGDTQVNTFTQFNKAVPGIGSDPASQQSYKDGVRRLLQDTQPKFNIPGFRTMPGEINMDYYNKLKGHADTFAQQKGINLALADSNQKKELLAGLDAHVKQSDPNFWKQKQFSDFALGNMVPNAGNTYSDKIISPLVNTHKALHYTGIAAAAAGVGIGGYALYKMIRSHLDKKKAENAEVQAQTY